MDFNKYIKITEKSDFWQKMEGSDYIIRDIGPDQYEVTKWSRGDTPTEIYRVEKRKTWTCNCPARKKPCKHIKLVQDWIKSGRKPFLDIGDLPIMIKKYLEKGAK